MIVKHATFTTDGTDYVTTGIAEEGTKKANHEIRVPKEAVDGDIVGETAATDLKAALEVAAQLVAAYKLKKV